jgi:hypothetical protein
MMLGGKAQARDDEWARVKLMTREDLRAGVELILSRLDALNGEMYLDEAERPMPRR